MKYRIKDIVSPARWRSVFIWMMRWFVVKVTSLLNKMDKVDYSGLAIGEVIVVDEKVKAILDRADDFERVHIIEQYAYRLFSCKKCVEAKECIHCHCAIPERMFVRSDKCSMGYWEAFKTEKEWKEYKDKLGINFKIEYVRK